MNAERYGGWMPLSRRRASDQAESDQEGAPEGAREPQDPSEENVALRIEWEMRRRRWSQERLAAEMASAGHPLHQSAISKIINPRADGKRRTISLGEAIGFARVFNTSLEELALPLELVQKQEAHLVIEHLRTLINDHAMTRSLLRIQWSRLKELLKDKDIRKRYIEWLTARGAASREARKYVDAWAERASDEERYDSFGYNEFPVLHDAGAISEEARVHQEVVVLTRLEAGIRVVAKRHESERDAITSWLNQAAPTIDRFGLVEPVAALLNRKLDGRSIDDVLNRITVEIDSKIHLVQAEMIKRRMPSNRGDSH